MFFLIVWLSAALGALFFYGASLPIGFFADDADWLYQAQRIVRGEAAFLEPVGRFRPLFALWFAGEYELFGLSPLPYHLVALVLHGLVTALVFWAGRCLAQRFGLSSFFPVYAAALFFFASTHYQPILWPAYQQDLLMTVLVLGSFLLVADANRLCRWRLAASAGLFLASLGVKEQGFFFPLALCFYLRTFAGRLFFWPLLFFLPLLTAAALFGLPGEIRLGYPQNLHAAEPHVGWNVLVGLLYLVSHGLSGLFGQIHPPGMEAFAQAAVPYVLWVKKPLVVVIPILCTLTLWYFIEIIHAYRTHKKLLAFLGLTYLLLLLPPAFLPYALSETGGFLGRYRYAYLPEVFLSLIFALFVSAFPKGGGQRFAMILTAVLSLNYLAAYWAFQAYHRHLGREVAVLVRLAEEACEGAKTVSFDGFPPVVQRRHVNHLQRFFRLHGLRAAVGFDMPQGGAACRLPVERFARRLFPTRTAR